MVKIRIAALSCTSLLALSLLFSSFLSPVACAQALRSDGTVDLTAMPQPSSEEIQALVRQNQQHVVDLTELGRKLFADTTLSASGKQACASCHSPAHAFGPPNALAVQAGGSRMTRSGTRAVPMLRYLQRTPVFTEHYFEDEGTKPGEDNGPTGGFTYDGRVDSLHEQARIPLFSPNEMANANVAQLAARLKGSKNAAELKRIFGSELFSDPEKTVAAVTQALEVFQQSPADFYPYTSKFDAFLRGKVSLTPSELKGLALFNDPGKGNCSSCHPSNIDADGSHPQFTDHGYAALGVPRNTRIPANADPRYFDLGLCGPDRKDLAAHPEYCGLFKVPSLRNVSQHKVYFHNGSFTDLTKLLRFYVQRDLLPQDWYPQDKHGRTRIFDDLPKAYRDNIETDAPFGKLPNGKPRLSEREIHDLVTFLKTLNDDYVVSQTKQIKR